MNKKLNYIFMLDCLGLVILFTCIIATFERDYGFKIFTNSKRPEFYYWIGMFYYGIISCWFDYQLISTKANSYKRKVNQYKIFSVIFSVLIFISTIVKL